ncbi:hypothetical protein [Brachybacterium hainanense]|uniref:Uncharacterized protein n=1 Tax=Brachybacterium hainanense TaxID=1541174 RepID=A0ABV6RGG4_9MICO
MRPQPWARMLTLLAVLAPVPSIIWRLLMLAGADLGFAEAQLFRTDPRGVSYVLALCVIEAAVCLACWGLIRPWGERLPRWLPGLGGRVIPRLLPTAVGLAGTLALVMILAPLLWSFGGAWLGITEAWTPTDGMTPAQSLLLGVMYAPFFLWPVPVAGAVVGYWRRREPLSRTPGSDVPAEG